MDSTLSAGSPTSLLDLNTSFGYNPTTGVDTTPEQVKRAGRRWEVAHAYTYSVNAALCDTWSGNRETLDLCAGDGFFRPVAVVSATQYRPCELVEWARQQRFAFVRLFPDLHGFAADGPACREVVAACGAARLPVMISAQAAGPAALLRGLEGVTATIVLTRNRYAVLGEVLALAGRLPEVYAETAGVNTPDGIARLAEAFGPEKLLFGSEYPLLQVGCAALLLRDSGLSPAEIEQIGSGNARRLFGEG